MLSQLKKAYRLLPPSLTGWLHFVPDSVIFGKSYRSCSPDDSKAVVESDLKRALDYSREHTEWGRAHIPQRIFKEEALSVVKSLPIVSSEELRADAHSFVSDQANKFNSYWTTTGETGRNPTNVCLSNQSYGIEWAHMMRIWKLGGYNRVNDVKLTFRGYSFDGLIQANPIYNEISVNPTLFATCDIHVFLNAIRKYKISCIHGYPTLIAVFKDKLKAAGVSFYVREIMLGSEGASVALKTELKNFFKAQVVSWYGLTEKVALAYDEHGTNEFKVFTSYGYPRIIDPDENGVGEIVGTTFVNFAMPLVNYRTGDYGRMEERADGIYIVDLRGRSGKDFVWRDKNTKFSVTAITMPKDVQRKIVFYQVIQTELGVVDLLFLPRAEFRGASSSIFHVIKSEAAKWLPGFNVRVTEAKSDADFKRSKRGKFKMLVQQLEV